MLQNSEYPGSYFNIHIYRVSRYIYKDYLYKAKTVMRLSYLYKRCSYAGKMVAV